MHAIKPVFGDYLVLDSHFTGMQASTYLVILGWMDSLIRIAEKLNITNEPIPMQLIRGWHH